MAVASLQPILNGHIYGVLCWYAISESTERSISVARFRWVFFCCVSLYCIFVKLYYFFVQYQIVAFGIALSCTKALHRELGHTLQRRTVARDGKSGARDTGSDTSRESAKWSNRMQVAKLLTRKKKGNCHSRSNYNLTSCCRSFGPQAALSIVAQQERIEARKKRDSCESLHRFCLQSLSVGEAQLR